jgi:DnaJ domain
VNHYQRLGVATDATHAEVRDAFRRAARGAHPDRDGGSAEQMGQVSEAWSVLGDADRRRRYDAELVAAARSEAESPSAPARSTTPDAAFGQVASDAYGPARFPWRFMAGMAVAGIALVVVGHLLSNPSPPPVPDGILRPGDCVVISEVLDADEVSCSDSHDAVVTVLVPIDQVCPAESEPFRDRQGLGTACVVRVAPP